ncbi:MAG: TIM44-like domain-containing protein [bacterium]|nr:TIM44-like domain-containing protein [bacterium]
MNPVYILDIFGQSSFSISSLSVFLVVLLFLEFCVFCYFTPNLFDLFHRKSSLCSGSEEDGEKHDENISSSFGDGDFDEEFFDSLAQKNEEIGSLILPDEEWLEDHCLDCHDETYSLLLELDPDFKIDTFYANVYFLYSNILDRYVEDDLREVSYFMTRELYQKNVKQLDYFRKRNLKHIVQVSEFLNCQILNCQRVGDEIYVTVELQTNSYDYIVNRTTGKVVRGVDDHTLHCVNHLILKKKIDHIQPSARELADMLFTSDIDLSYYQDSDNWALVENKIVRRRSK